MNRKMILYITGIITLLEAGLMALPAIVALIYRERSGISFLITMGICAVLGALAVLRKPKIEPCSQRTALWLSAFAGSR